MQGYAVEQHAHGVLVTGSHMPVGEFAALASLWKKQGWTLLDPGIAKSLGALFAVTNKKHRAAWMAEAQEKARYKSAGDAELEWLYGTDTGISSLTIFATLTEKNGRAAQAQLRGRTSEPLDPDDFGRCRRLLALFPAWRARLGEVAMASPEWTALVREWDMIDALYAEEEPTGRAPKCYALMQKCREESGCFA